MSSAVLVTLLIFFIPAVRSKAEAPSGTRAKHSLFFGTGGLFGGKTEVPPYDESFYRRYSKAGCGCEVSREEDSRGNRYGLAITGALGSGDRLCINSKSAILKGNLSCGKI